MKSIGIRELRQNASVYIRLVKAGETVEVTDRGEPVARLVPIHTEPENGYARLVRRGLVIPPRDPGRLLRGSPVPLAPGEHPPSEVLDEMRADER
jgi:prevent-host-death family protein